MFKVGDICLLKYREGGYFNKKVIITEEENTVCNTTNYWIRLVSGADWSNLPYQDRIRTRNDKEEVVCAGNYLDLIKIKIIKPYGIVNFLNSLEHK